MSLSVRSKQEELMDSPVTSAADYEQCLSDLEKVNRLTLTHRPTLRWLARAMHAIPGTTPVSILDVGYGRGDFLRALHRWGAARCRTLILTGIDLNSRSAAAARAATAAEMQIEYCVGDVFDCTPRPRPDFIVSSQFAHHLDDAQVLEFVRWMEANCTRGWYVADLQRHAISHFAFPFIARIAGWHNIVRDDGTVSIARSFHIAEWHEILRQAKVRADVRWHIPFRLGVGRVK
ncbi:MAG TPA: methyltransferase domain-containing protein [Burkholderiaceae bacterium]|nr:methyltransferase domain-containing protein [Burkholderiaceae bacterium]